MTPLNNNQEEEQKQGQQGTKQGAPSTDTQAQARARGDQPTSEAGLYQQGEAADHHGLNASGSRSSEN